MGSQHLDDDATKNAQHVAADSTGQSISSINDRSMLGWINGGPNPDGRCGWGVGIVGLQQATSGFRMARTSCGSSLSLAATVVTNG